MEKKCKVIMLETDNTSMIHLTSHGMIIPSIVLTAASDLYHTNPQHLYILSDDEIKAPCYIADKRGIYPITVDLDSYIGLLKVIATTDLSLNLPSIPQSFINKYIDEYNKGNKIEEVMVEYDINCNPELKAMLGEVYSLYKLKLNSDNTIDVKFIKDSWTREEVIELLRSLDDGSGYFASTIIDNFIYSNL